MRPPAIAKQRHGRPANARRGASGPPSVPDMTATEQQAIVQRLREHATLGGAPLQELEWLAANGDMRRYAAGEMPIRQGQLAGMNGLMVVLTGHVVLYVNRGRGRRKLSEWHGGEVSGVLPYSRVTVAIGDGVAESDSEIGRVERDRVAAMN